MVILSGKVADMEELKNALSPDEVDSAPTGGHGEEEQLPSDSANSTENYLQCIQVVADRLVKVEREINAAQAELRNLRKTKQELLEFLLGMVQRGADEVLPQQTGDKPSLIADLDIPPGVKLLLAKAGIHTVAELLQQRADDRLVAVKGLGKAKLAIIEAALEKHGLV